MIKIKTVFCGMLIILVVGCSSMTTKDQQIDKECDSLAVYARGVTQWKLMGATKEDISSVSSNPIVLTFQQAYIRDRIFRSDFRNPARAYSRFYNECVMNGYKQTLSFYENETFRLMSLTGKK